MTEATNTGGNGHGKPILRVRNLRKHFPIKGGLFGRSKLTVKAVDGIDLTLGERETLGLVGESGCGKTTAGRLILQLIPPDRGSEIHFRDSPNLATLRAKQMLPYRRHLQMIFQDPYSSLNPRMTVGSIIGEALTIHRLAKGQAKWDRIEYLLRAVGLNPGHIKRFPHEFSGGQRQRIGIARALAVEPEIIICDEPVSALDVSIQAQIINLLQDLQAQFGLSFVFVAHDLSVVGHISHRVAVMYLGRIVEVGTKAGIFENPLHPYTRLLLQAVPQPDPAKRAKRRLLEGDVPSPVNPPRGCHFHPRCPEAKPVCAEIDPVLAEESPGHCVACHLYAGSREASEARAPAASPAA
ncbi:MAG: ATP-binding cassette domain-containing protein [Candidatus Sumerlaeia bacterium]|nr:ATP-binding cassette domain-containing protein [Candidatus Sumerlaeia bacterium]